MSREKLELTHPEHDYNWRFDGDQLWLLDDERQVGYAKGMTVRWHLAIGERSLLISQGKMGTNQSAIMENDELVSEVGGGGFPLKVVELNRSAGLSDEEQAFVVAVALLGWREADRAMMSVANVGDSGGGSG